MGRFVTAALAWAALAFAARAEVRLDLGGFIDADGAVAVQHAGDTVDPYFALQAFLLAHDNGLDARADARRWARWLLPRQKPDATFDRFCRRGPVWAPCKTADADDALHALWLRFLRAFPMETSADGRWRKSAAASAASLARLLQPAAGYYWASPVVPHGLYLDNLEVWTLDRSPALARSIHAAFWDAGERRFRVSTQLEHGGAPRAFYPDAVAQLFALAVGFPHLPADATTYHRDWMRRHRGEWLRQVRTDFAWGLVAVVALRHGDRAAAACWLREALPFRHGPHWTVTDEVSRQVLLARGVAAAGASEDCA